MGHIEMPKKYRNYKKTSKTPRKPFDRDRLISELKVVGQFGLRCKREVWRVQLSLLKEGERSLDYVLGLTLDQFLERRLQTVLVKKDMAKSVHHARVLLR